MIEGVSVMVGVGVMLGVNVGVGVRVGDGVGVGVGVWVEVGVLLGVAVGEASRLSGALQADSSGAARARVSPHRRSRRSRIPVREFTARV